MKTETKVIPCACYGEGLILRKDEDDFLEVYFYTIGCEGKKLGFKDKLRYIWRVITIGKPFGDQVMLDEQRMIELRDYLNLQIDTQTE